MPPEIEEIGRGEWTYRGRSEHIINAHIEVGLSGWSGDDGGGSSVW